MNKINMGRQYGNQSDQGKLHFTSTDKILALKPSKRELEGNLEDLSIHNETLIYKEAQTLIIRLNTWNFPESTKISSKLLNPKIYDHTELAAVVTI